MARTASISEGPFEHCDVSPLRRISGVSNPRQTQPLIGTGPPPPFPGARPDARAAAYARSIFMAAGHPTGPRPISITTGTPAAVLPDPHLCPVAAGAGDCAVDVAAADLAGLPVPHPVSAHPVSTARASQAEYATPAGRGGERRMGSPFAPLIMP